jgi:hypothetical protein
MVYKLLGIDAEQSNGNYSHLQIYFLTKSKHLALIVEQTVVPEADTLLKQV